MTLEPFFEKGLSIEVSREAQRLHKMLHPSLRLTWSQSYLRVPQPKQTLGFFSYVLTEVPALPDWAYELEALMIVEPSTQQDGRKLMEMRAQLISKGYSIWAPCLHQLECPLLTHSKKDWCHDRVHWEMPDWFSELDQQLPMKNKTVTFSFLLARRRPPAQSQPNMVRSVGDLLIEKGKTRMMICRNDQREFLSFLHRDFEQDNLYRGDLYELPEFETKTGELRIRQPIQIPE